MSPELALANLRTDAAFYQLDGLVEQCNALIAQSLVEGGPRKQYQILGSEYEHLSNCSFESQMGIALKAKTWSTRVTAERLAQEPFVNMERPEKHLGFSGLRTIAAVERFAREMCGVEPQLVGWHVEASPEQMFGVVYSRLVVVLTL
ncbi:hypothetical protein FRC11_005884 [Ceratobasidium sp. 423]|nr:hypothetical protein FRC11_005884 [Ceratobasidium sp. 423]